MVHCHLNRLMGERRLKIMDVVRGAGVTRTGVTSLYNDTATRIDVEMIDRLCKFLNCSVGELFEYIPESM
jgi:putative transcriptional regulator